VCVCVCLCVSSAQYIKHFAHDPGNHRFILFSLADVVIQA